MAGSSVRAGGGRRTGGTVKAPADRRDVAQINGRLVGGRGQQFIGNSRPMMARRRTA